jgi:nucleoside-diphosphate-sugar epimerase
VAQSVPVTIVRPPAVYGPRDKDVFEFFHTMNRGLQPMIGFRDKFVSLIHVTDLVRGFVLAGESPKAAGQTYFISSSTVYSWKELGEITKKVIGKRSFAVRIPETVVYLVAAFSELGALFSSKPALINFEKARDIVQDYWTCDASKAKTDFGYEQEISIEEGIRSTVEWYRKMEWM